MFAGSFPQVCWKMVVFQNALEDFFKFFVLVLGYMIIFKSVYMLLIALDEHNI